MFEHGFPPYWSTLKKLIWLVGAGIAGGVSEVWKTVTGALIHITDALASPMRKCEVTLEPIQDLHGQDAPYPAGGGVNKFNPSNATPVGTAFSYGLTATINADESIRISGTPTWSADLSSPTFNIFETTDDYSGLTGNVFTVSKSSNITSVNSISYNASTHRIAINVTKTGTDAVDFTIRVSYASASQSSWSPNSNICPITGWTGCEVTRTGKNLLNPANVLESTYVSNGAIALHNSYNLYYASVKPNTKYTLYQGNPNEGYPIIAFCNDLPARGVSASATTSIKGKSAYTFDTGDYKYALFCLYKTAGTQNWLSLGETTGDTYTAYSGTTLSVTFPDSAGTLYGGTLDVVTGELVVDKVKVTYQQIENSLTGFGVGTSCSRMYANISSFHLYYITGWNYNGAICNIASEKVTRYAGAVNPLDDPTFSPPGFAYSDTYLHIMMSPSITNKEDFKALISGFEMVAPLATPITYQLTPQQIATLKGENNVWGSGDLEITYKAQA